jgi:hypothetical protein
MLGILENGRASSKSRRRDEGDGQSNNRHELRHSSSPKLICTSCGAEPYDRRGHTRKETGKLQDYSQRGCSPL